MIRVLQVVTSMDFGGIEVLLMNLYSNIDRNQLQFDFLLHRAEESEFETKIKAMGGRIYRVPQVNPLRHFGYLRALKAFFREHADYHIVHAHNNAFSMYVLREAKKVGVPICIAHSHTANVSFDIKRSLFNYYCRKRILNYTDYAFACSKAAGIWLFGKNILVNPIFHVVNNSIDCKRFAFSSQVREAVRSKLGIADELVIGHVGRFSPEKNHAFILKIFEHLLKLRPGALLLLVGDGPLMPAMQQQAQALGITGQVRFLGSRGDVPDLLQAMDVFLLPSKYEGFAVTLVEAQASGLYCVVSDSLSKEMSLTTRVDFLPFRLGADRWAEACLQRASILDRQDCSKEIRDAGFHVVDSAAWLQGFYLSKLALKGEG